MMQSAFSILACSTLVLALSTSADAASVECKFGRSDKLVLMRWSAEPGRNGPTITFTAKSSLARALRSINATMVFVDAEGKTLADLPLSPDLKIAPGAESEEDDSVTEPDMNAALVAPGVAAAICVRYVEYGDGSFEEF